MSLAQKKQLVNECNLLKDLRHSNIVRYYERIVDKTNGCIYIIMEYCEGGDLACLIARESKVIKEDLVWLIFSQLVGALDACHSGILISSNQKVCVLHRDIKPENVFLDSRYNVKLGDFGLSRVINESINLASTFVGTPYYMSPELVQESTYNSKSDIWSLGCLVYELCALVPPFQANNEQQLYGKIKLGNVERLPSRYSDELDSVVKLMLSVDKDQRPSSKELLNLPKIRFCLKTIELEDKERFLLQKEQDLKAMEVKILEKSRILEYREKELEKKMLSINEKENEDDIGLMLLNSPSLMIFSPTVQKDHRTESNILTESPTQLLKNHPITSGFKFTPSSYFPISNNPN